MKNRICVAAVFNNAGQRAVYRPGVKPADGGGNPGRLPDRILVMEKGRIAEAGTHEELLAAGGLYSRMWKAQAESYQG